MACWLNIKNSEVNVKKILLTLALTALTAVYPIAAQEAAVKSHPMGGGATKHAADEAPNAVLGGTLRIGSPNRNALPGSTFLYPILVDIEGFNVADFQFDLVFNPAVLTAPVCSTGGTLTGAAGISVLCSVSGGNRLSVVGFSSGGTVTGEGVLLNIQFTVAAGAVVGNSSAMELQNALFFELAAQVPPTAVIVTSGTLTIAGTTAADVAVVGRVLDASGRGVAKARVRMDGGDGEPRFAITNGFGY